MTQSVKDSAMPTPEDNGQGAAKSAAPASADAGKGAASKDKAAAADARDAAEGGLDPELVAEAAEAVENAMDESDESEAVAAAKAEVAEWKDKYIRLHAEWDTYRRRTKEQQAAEKARATEKLVESLIPVIDDFERTIAYAKENGEKGLLGGVEAVHSKLLDTLKRDGVQIIDPAGEPFDALEAQAVATVDDPSVPDETVAEVYQKGYRMADKVLRPATVTVTTGGPRRASEKSED